MPSDAHIDLPYTLPPRHAHAPPARAGAKPRELARLPWPGRPKNPVVAYDTPLTCSGQRRTRHGVRHNAPHSPTQQVGARCEDLAAAISKRMG